MKENQIAVLAGEYPSKVERGEFDLNVSLPENIPIGLPSTLLQRRPDVRQAEQQLQAAMAAVGIAYADRFPRLTISLVGGLENDELKGFFESPFSYVSVYYTHLTLPTNREVLRLGYKKTMRQKKKN